MSQEYLGHKTSSMSHLASRNPLPHLKSEDNFLFCPWPQSPYLVVVLALVVLLGHGVQRTDPTWPQACVAPVVGTGRPGSSGDHAMASCYRTSVPFLRTLVCLALHRTGRNRDEWKSASSEAAKQVPKQMVINANSTEE